jgi:peptidyl-prolyl cis-trans isomerase SurA
VRPVVAAAGLLVALCGALLLGTPSPAGAVEQVLERIVAVVGNEIILLSEVDEEVLLAQVREGLDLADTNAVKAHREKTLQALVEQKILLAKARAEGMRVSRDELERAVDARLQDVRSRFPSEEAFAAQLAREGINFEDLRATYTRRVEEQLLIAKLVDAEIRSHVNVQESDIRRYWEEHRGEIPSLPATLELRRIFIDPRKIDFAGEPAVERAEMVRERLLQGEDFGTLAQVFSEGPNASRGGELGWFRAGDLDPVLESAIEGLEPGQISSVVVSSRGAHLLKLEERRGGQFRLRQIIFLRNEEAARAAARARAESILRRLWDGEDFEAVARAESDDPAARETGGSVGSVPIESLGPAYRSQLEGLAPGEISGVIETEDGFSIFRLEDRQGERPATYEDAHEHLRALLEQDQAAELYAEFVEKAREEIYVSIRTESEG